MVPKYLIGNNEPQDFGNNWGLFIDIENSRNENEKEVNTSLNYKVIIYDNIESQMYSNDKNKFNLFNCLTTIVITSCLTYIVLCIL